MIMICNVPDKVVKSVRMGTWCGGSIAEKMIANGIPLEQIRVEIEHVKDNPLFGMVSNDTMLEVVLEIIDKYNTDKEQNE
jgi:hypothetical protein